MTGMRTLLRVWLYGMPFAGAALDAQVDTLRRDTTRVRLAPVVVSTPRAPSTTGGASQVTIPLDSLRLSATPALEEVLREMPFLLVRTNSRGEAELSVRGSDSRQAAVIVDGIPLSLGWDHRSDPSLVPLTGARGVSLVRGLSSLLYGPNTLGGLLSVDVSGGDGADATRGDLALRFGTDQLGSGNLGVVAVVPWLRAGSQWTFRTAAALREQPGVALARGVADTLSVKGRRTNSYANQVDGFASIRYSGPRGRWFGLSASAYDADRGVAPELHLLAPRYWRYPQQSRQLAIASFGTGRFKTPLGAADMELIVGRNAGKTRIESYSDGRYLTVAGRERNDDHATTARLLFDHDVGRGELRTALTYANVRVDERLDAAPIVKYHQRLWSGAAEVELPLPALIRVTTGLALDGAETPLSGDKQPLGKLDAVGVRAGISGLTAGGRLRWHGSVNRRSRFPALRELYSGALGQFEPNPSLRPETLVGAEAGATYITSRTQLQAVVFRSTLDDAIVRVSLPNRRQQRVNRDQLRAAGLELLGAWTVGAASLSADALLQHLRIEDPAVSGTERRPEHQPSVRLGADVTTPIGAGLRANVAAHHSGATYCVNPEQSRQQRLASQRWIDVSAEREWELRPAGLLSRLRAIVGLHNVTDRAVFDQCGLPRPGRTLRLSVSLG